MTTLEQVEKLRSMSNISYDEAKAALDATNGDILEAVIMLEKQGKIVTPPGGGYYSSERTANPGNGLYQGNSTGSQNQANANKETFSSLLKKFGHFCLKLLRKGNSNSFEVLKDNESKASMPVTALVLLLIFAFWVTVPLAIIGLFFGFRYRFVGPEFKGNTVNNVMNSAADAAEELKKSVDISKH